MISWRKRVYQGVVQYINTLPTTSVLSDSKLDLSYFRVYSTKFVTKIKSDLEKQARSSD